MFTTEQIDRLLNQGANVLSEDGEKIGSIGQVFVDNEDGQPSWVTVRTGLFGMSESFVPLEGARTEGNDIVVPYSKNQVKDAPRIDADRPLEPAEEDRLYQHYQLDAGRTYDRSARQNLQIPRPEQSAPAHPPPRAPTAPDTTHRRTARRHRRTAPKSAPAAPTSDTTTPERTEAPTAGRRPLPPPDTIRPHAPNNETPPQTGTQAPGAAAHRVPARARAHTTPAAATRHSTRPLPPSTETPPHRAPQPPARPATTPPLPPNNGTQHRTAPKHRALAGTGPGTAGYDTATPTEQRDTTPDRTQAPRRAPAHRVPVHPSATGRSRLRKYVTTEQVTKTVPVQREEVRIEREPITEENRDEAIEPSGQGRRARRHPPRRTSDSHQGDRPRGTCPHRHRNGYR